MIRNRKKTWIPVVTGLLQKDGKVLIGQRPKGSLQGQWEFPGGKIEIGESPEEALKRELKEEIDVDATVGDLRMAMTHAYGDRGVIILFYDIPKWKGEPKLLQHLELKWVEPPELKRYDIPDANKKVLDEIIEILKNS